MSRRSTRKRGDRFQRAVTLFEMHGGILRTAEALRAGIHPHTLYAMRDAGRLERISRGVYRLAERPPLGNPDLVTVAKRVPNGVICLISALAFHDLTTQIHTKCTWHCPVAPRSHGWTSLLYVHSDSPESLSPKGLKPTGWTAFLSASTARRRPWPTASSSGTRSVWTRSSKRFVFTVSGET